MATIANIVGFDLPDDAAEDSYNLLPLFIKLPFFQTSTKNYINFFSMITKIE